MEKPAVCGRRECWFNEAKRRHGIVSSRVHADERKASNSKCNNGHRYWRLCLIERRCPARSVRKQTEGLRGVHHGNQPT